ncbi:hypothetical protein ACIHFE_18495 [Streptomyces sp. NPDC052396]|uniref:hypothetical protein n=1 Tax=Streptomyces sp. NPDC052396 TaxID=3365689 RepID=UPI0037D2348B
MTEYTVELIHDKWPKREPSYFASLAADPPDGFEFSFRTWDHYPGITGTREAPTVFHAIAEVAGEVARKHGVLLNDTGVEKVHEWIHGEWNQQITAHLLLMAAHRATYCGLGLDDLIGLLRSLEPAFAPAGEEDAP